MMKEIVIIGNGVAGITAARHIRKLSDFKITVVSSETEHFFSRTALMYVYMGHMTFEHIKPYEDWFWAKNKIDLAYDRVDYVDANKKQVLLKSGKWIKYDQLIIASGSSSNPLDVPGYSLAGVQTLYSYDDLLAMDAKSRNVQRAVVVGGGLIGIEMAEMLRSRNIETTILIRERAFWNNVLPFPEAAMISRHIASHGVHVLHERELAAILSDQRGGIRAIRTHKGEELPCEFVGVAVGVHPNVEWLRSSSIEINRGIVVNRFLETNITDVFAIGDCAERCDAIDGRANIEQVWYTARIMGETVAQTICGNRTAYTPGPWFNSAKFFDIEFQTYGTVRSEPADGEDHFYWEHSSGKKAIRVAWNRDTETFTGINAFGIRLRHEYFDRWLRDGRSIGYVVGNLRVANFDPEFAERYEDEFTRRFMDVHATPARP